METNCESNCKTGILSPENSSSRESKFLRYPVCQTWISLGLSAVVRTTARNVVEVFSDEFLLGPLDELYLHNAATALLPSTDVASLSSIGLMLTSI